MSKLNFGTLSGGIGSLSNTYTPPTDIMKDAETQRMRASQVAMPAQQLADQQAQVFNSLLNQTTPEPSGSPAQDTPQEPPKEVLNTVTGGDGSFDNRLTLDTPLYDPVYNDFQFPLNMPSIPMFDIQQLPNVPNIPPLPPRTGIMSPPSGIGTLIDPLFPNRPPINMPRNMMDSITALLPSRMEV